MQELFSLCPIVAFSDTQTQKQRQGQFMGFIHILKKKKKLFSGKEKQYIPFLKVYKIPTYKPVQQQYRHVTQSTAIYCSYSYL